jgi:hypothetical protein
VNKERLLEIANEMYDCGARQEYDLLNCEGGLESMSTFWAKRADTLMDELRGILGIPPPAEH